MSLGASTAVAAGAPLDNISFEYLADRDRALAPYLDCRTKLIDFNDAEAVRCLSQAILKVYFSLTVKLPTDRLCPMVPGRWEYVRWIQELVESTGDTYLPDGSVNARGRVTGIDIGTGSSAIYALLMAKTRPAWCVVGTDIDLDSLSQAVENIRLNSLELQVSVLRQTPSDLLFPVSKISEGEIAFTMCNPPFYSSKAEIEASANAKAKMALTVCTGAEVEMITEGGELAFAARMLEESKDPVVHHRIQWFSSLFGKLENAIEIASRLKTSGIDNVATTKIEIGNHTKRWVVAWSLQNKRPSNSCVTRKPDFTNQAGYCPTEATITFKLQPNSAHSSYGVESNIDFLIGRLRAKVMVEGNWNWNTKSQSGLFVTTGQPWTRQGRRKRAREAAAAAEAASKGSNNAYPEQETTKVQNNQATNTEQVFAVSLRFCSTQSEGAASDLSDKVVKGRSEELSMHVRWLQGPSTRGWQSFLSIVRNTRDQIAEETGTKSKAT